MAKFDEKWMERDLFGYGPDRPDAKWPKGAKIAVNFVLNHEEGGERSVEDGDEHAETVLHEFGQLVSYRTESTKTDGLQLDPELGVRDPPTETQFDYGTRAAIWRIMRIFKKHDIPITFYAVGRAFERNPAVAKYAEENGHEVASHCYKWKPYTGMTDDEEEEYIRKAVASFKATSPSGKVPVGWYYGRPSARSLPLVAKVYRELGHELLYWADTYADDLPYWTNMPGGKSEEGLVMMPYTLDCNDFKFWQGQMGSDDAFAQHCINAFDTIREEGLEGKPAYITVALHSRWIGRPGRFQALKRMIEYFTSHDDVWFATREQIARHWTKEYPYTPKK
ncbi:allantoinase, partial [Tremellales sp. Uapishka_1]